MQMLQAKATLKSLTDAGKPEDEIKAASDKVIELEAKFSKTESELTSRIVADQQS